MHAGAMETADLLTVTALHLCPDLGHADPSKGFNGVWTSVGPLLLGKAPSSLEDCEGESQPANERERERAINEAE